MLTRPPRTPAHRAPIGGRPGPALLPGPARHGPAATLISLSRRRVRCTISSVDIFSTSSPTPSCGGTTAASPWARPAARPYPGTPGPGPSPPTHPTPTPSFRRPAGAHTAQIRGGRFRTADSGRRQRHGRDGQPGAPAHPPLPPATAAAPIAAPAARGRAESAGGAGSGRRVMCRPQTC